ncbi:MAG: glycosyltransferase family 2 protein [Mobilitalea sp.]
MMISIITVCLNSEFTIRDTLESVLSQDYSEYEYIIIDGKSKDKTLDILEEYIKKFNGKMRIISETDSGIYDAMNKAIKLAKGDLIGFINSDDWYESNAISLIADNYIPDCMQVIYGMQKIIDRNKEMLCWIKNHEFLEKSMITFPTCFISKEVYDKYGVYDLKYKSASDYDYLLKLYYSKNVIFTPIYKVISNFRFGGLSGSNIGNIENAIIRNKYGLISFRKMKKIIYNNRLKIVIKKLKIVKWYRNRGKKLC